MTTRIGVGVSNVRVLGNPSSWMIPIDALFSRMYTRQANRPSSCEHEPNQRIVPLSLVAGVLLALMTINVHADTCDEVQANACFVDCDEVQAKACFVDAANLVRRAESSSREERLVALEEALKMLEDITNTLKGTSLAVKLASGQRIGNISIKLLKTQIQILASKNCQCTPLHSAMESALWIEDFDVRDNVFATIARKLVRRNEFARAQDLVQLIENEKKRRRLRLHVTRAQIRDDLKDERRYSWRWP